jgi:hypothetical protein
VVSVDSVAGAEDALSGSEESFLRSVKYAHPGSEEFFF